MYNFKKLEIWGEAMEIVTEIYQLTSDLPVNENFGLKSQTRRAAVSVPSNIAEGNSRNSDKENNRFIEIAIGSSNELITLILIGKNLDFYKQKQIDPVINRLEKLQRRLYTSKKRLTANSHQLTANRRMRK